MSHIRHLRLFVTCISAAANALCAGGVFTFPLMSPALVAHLKLTQPQLTTIALAGMTGQYPFAAVVGKVIDRYGPWACSLVSACLFSSGFGLFAREIAKTPDDISQPSSSSFHHLTLYFFIAGLGTVFSYFSSVFSASKNFPDFIGMASGTMMALFGLSPMFFSLVASTFFSTPQNGLDVTHYLQFLCILCGSVHLLGALALTIPASDRVDSDVVSEAEDDPEAAADENTSLIPGKRPQAQVQVIPVEEADAVADLLRDGNFWLLAFVTFVVLGSSEMVLSNIGTIVLSVPAQSSSIVKAFEASSDATTSLQVRILSLANTISRLLVGPLADFISPVAFLLPSGERSFTRKHHMSRVLFLTFSTTVLALTFSWMVVGVHSEASLWALSAGVGIAYGCAFTVLPSLVSSIWGMPNLGRNYGVLTYAPFIGTPCFSYLYAFVADRQHQSYSVCKGVECWQLTFFVSLIAAVVALCATLRLWKTWKGMV